MKFRVLVPTLAVLAAALYAEDGAAPAAAAEQGKAVSISIDLKPRDAEPGMTNLFQLEVQNKTPGQENLIEWRFDIPDLENVHAVADAPLVTLATVRTFYLENVVPYHERVKALLSSIRDTTAAESAELLRELDAQKKRYVELAIQLQELAQTAELQGVKIAEDPAYAETMCALKRLLAVQNVEMDLLREDVYNQEENDEENAEESKGGIAIYTMTVGIADKEVEQQDIKKQVAELNACAYHALGYVVDALNFITNAKTADALADVLAENAREVEKCRLLIEWYIRNESEETVQQLQPATKEVLYAKVQDKLKALAKADCYGCDRLAACIDRYGWLHDSIDIFTVNLNTDAQEGDSQEESKAVKVDVSWKEEKDAATGEVLIKDVNATVQDAEPAAGQAAPAPESGN